MEITINGKTYTLAFTFNSFRHMEDIDVSSFEALETKPFKMISILSDLFFGAMNHNRKKFVNRETCDDLLETYANDENNDIAELTANLMDMLQSTSFFKQRQ